MKIKMFCKRILIVFLIICMLLPVLFSGIAFADEEITVEVNNKVLLTQERAGNYVASFAINFYNNWSSKEHIYEETDKDNPIKTRFSATANEFPQESQNAYYLSKTLWINFTYAKALSLDVNTKYPTAHFSDSDKYYEKIDVSDLDAESMLKLAEDKNTEETDENGEQEEKTVEQTTVELMNSGKIKPGDILVTSSPDSYSVKDYLLYVGGTKVIYATPGATEGHPTEGGSALKYDYIQNYFVEVRRFLEEKHEATTGNETEQNEQNEENEENEYIPQYGVTEIYRITPDAIKEWNLTDDKVNLFYNNRGYYDADNKYSGIPIESSYDGREKVGLISFIIDGLLAIIKFLINLTLFVLRAVIVGWVNLFESLVQNTILKISGHTAQVSFTDKFLGVSTTSYSGQRVTIESIIFNKLPLTDANFFNFETAGGYSLLNENGEPISWIYTLRKNLAYIYIVLRNFSIAAMLFVIMYMAIRMVMSNLAPQKAKYNKMLTSWFVGLCIILFIHIFMYMVLFVNDTLINIFLEQNTNVASQIVGIDDDALTLYDAIRTKAYSWDFYDGLVGLILYIVEIYFLLKFLFIYLKRMISIYVLGLYGSIIGLRYAIDKSSGRRSKNNFSRWMKDFIFNVLLQTIHALVYLVFMAVSLKIALTSASGIIVAFIVLKFMLEADKIFMRIFNIKGSLLDDTNKPPELRGMFGTIKSAVTGAAIGWGVFQFGRQLFGRDTGIRPILRYSLNYRKGDTNAQTIARGESKLLNFEAGLAGKFYQYASVLPIESLQRKRRAYYLMRKSGSYQVKRNIKASLDKERKIKRERFSRKFSHYGNNALGAFELLGSAGLATEGLQLGAIGIANALKRLRGPAQSRRNARLYRRVNPDESIGRGTKGILTLANVKSGKDLKKAEDKTRAAMRIANREAQLEERARRISRVTGMSHEDAKHELNKTMKIAGSSGISGTMVKAAVDSHLIAEGGKKTIGEEDIEGVISMLQRRLDKGHTGLSVNDEFMVARIKDAIDEVIIERVADGTLDESVVSLQDLDSKTFAEILTEAINGPEVMPVVAYGRIEAASDEIYDERLKNRMQELNVDRDKLARMLMSEYEKESGYTLTAEQKSQLKAQITQLPNISEMDINEAIQQIMLLMERMDINQDRIRESAESVMNAQKGRFGEETIDARALSDELISKYERATGSTLTDEQKAEIQKKMQYLSDVTVDPNSAEHDEMVDKAMKLIRDVNSSNPDVPAIDEGQMRAIVDSTSISVTSNPDKEFDRLIAEIQKKMRSKGLAVELTDEIKAQIKERVIEAQKAHIEGDTSRAADMDKLNNGHVIAADSTENGREEFLKIVYEASAAEGLVPTSSAVEAEKKRIKKENAERRAAGQAPIDAATEQERLRAAQVVQSELQEAAKTMKQMKAINEANRARNKESAVGYGGIMHDLLQNF